MQTKNRAATFFGLLVLGLVAFILYWGATKPIDVLIQAGHQGRTTGNTGAVSRLYHEETWNILVADEVARLLRSWHIGVKRIPAKVTFTRATIAISIHFDGATTPCNSGASIGYPSEASHDFAQRWKSLYKSYYPFKWHDDNFTPNLANYYAYEWISADKFLLLELGEITCDAQTTWLQPRLKKIAHLIAYAIATELGRNIERPKL